MDHPGKVANPARGQLNRENEYPLSQCVPETLVSRDGFSRPVPRQPAHLHTQAESGAYLRDSSRVPRRRPFMKPPYAIGSVSSLSGHAIAYRWRSLPRVRRHRCAGFKSLCVLKVRNVVVIIYWSYTPFLLWEYLKLPPHETTPPTASPSCVSLVHAADLVGTPITLSRKNTVRARLDP